MKKILVMADTHGNRAAIWEAMRQYKDIDAVIHLGDYARDAKHIKAETKAEVYVVRGNCDVSYSEPQEQMITIEGVRILAVHGHRQNVKTDLLGLGLYAQEKGADIACFGHTHQPEEQIFQGTILYNPGSLGEPRHLKPSVGVITVDEGAVSVKTHFIV